MNQSPSELHHKMCKKVAQLTKVIFYLNTKNDEYESNLKSVVNAYESQLDITIREANNIISKYKEAAQKANKNDQLEKQLRKIQENVQRQKQRSYQQFQKYQKSVEEKESKTQNETNRKIREYETEVESMRGRLQALSRTLDQVATKLQNERKNHEKTLNDYVRQQNEKYNTLLKKKIQIQEDLNSRKIKVSELQKMIADLKRQLEDEIRKHKMSAQSLLEELKKESQRKIAELSEKLQKAQKKLASCQLQIQSLKSQLQEKHVQINHLQAKISKLEQNIRQGEVMMQNMRSEINSLSKQCGDLKQTKRQLQKDNQLLSKTIKQLEDRLNLVSRESSLKNGEFDSMRQQYERQLGEKNTEIKMLKEKNLQWQRKIEILNLQLAGLKDANDKNNMEKLRQIQKLKQIIQELNSRLDSLKNNSTDQMKELQRLLKEKTSKFEQEIKNIISRYEEDIKKIHEKHNEEVQKLKQKHRQQIEDLKRQSQDEKARIRADYERRIKLLQEKLAQQIRKMQDSNGYLKKMYEQKINNYQRTIRDFQQSQSSKQLQISNLTKKIQSLQNEIQQLRKQKINMAQKNSSLQAELDCLRKERMMLQGNLGEEIESLRKKLQQQQYSYQQRIRLLRKDHEDQLDVQKRLLHQRFEDEKRKMEIKHESHVQEVESKLNSRIRELEAQLKGMSNRSQLTNSQWLDKIRKMEEEHQTILQGINKKHINELKEAQVKFDNKIVALKKEFAQNLEKRQLQLNRLKLKQQEELKNKWETQKNFIISDYEEKLSKLSKNFDIQSESLKRQFQQKLKEVEARLQSQKKSHTETRNRFKDLQNSFGILGKQLDQERDSHLKTKNTLMDRQDQIRTLSIKIQTLIKENSDQINRIKSQYQYREDQQKRQHDKKIQGLVNEQIQWTHQIKKEFNNMIEENKSRISLMEEQYNELKALFDDRPSREEDLRMIQKLQALLEQREDQLKKAWHQLKFYKLQLLNRENNFNKLFNANPNVGVLNPLEAMTKPQQKAQTSLPSVVASTKKSIK